MREAAAERPEAAVAGDPVWVDGLDAQSVSVRERALQYGDGLFETLSCIDGRPRWLSLHLARLSEGCERLRLPFQAYGTLAAEIRALAAGQDRCVVKVIVSRGASSQRGYGVRAALAPTRIVSRHPWPAARSGALALGTSEVCLGENPALAGLKHLNRLEQVMAQLRRPVDLDEVLMLSSSRRVIGGSMSNVFLVDDTGLFTPSVTVCGVAGVMRRVLLALLQASGGPTAQVREVASEELTRVREVFVTNVCWGVASVGRLDGRPLPSDDWAQRLRRLLDAQSP